MPDPGLRVRAAADRVITHHVLDDLTELERHTEPVRDGIAMRLDRPLPTLTSDRKCWWRVVIPQLRCSSVVAAPAAGLE